MQRRATEPARCATGRGNGPGPGGACWGSSAGTPSAAWLNSRAGTRSVRNIPTACATWRTGGPFNTIAGQPTDDSEMALMLARSLVAKRAFDRRTVRKRYGEWLDSGPFDCGNTIWQGLNGERNFESQANGALMRISPLGIFGAGRNLDDVAEWARQDASITHPNPVCQQANALFAMAIATAISQGTDGRSLHGESFPGRSSTMSIPHFAKPSRRLIRNPGSTGPYPRQVGS